MTLIAPIPVLKSRAKQLARREGLPLHEALDHVARMAGFARWSLLAAQTASPAAPSPLLSRLEDGDLLLIAARPRHGKTLLGLQLLLDAAAEGRRAVFFSLEETADGARRKLLSLCGGDAARADAIDVATSDEIDADYVIQTLSAASGPCVAVIDYLQILDHPRRKPALAAQIDALSAFARGGDRVLAFISQIERGFDLTTRRVPDRRDIRMPNPVDLRAFSKACFLHDGVAAFEEAA